MSGFVCHLERADDGGLASARLVGPGFDQTWNAPPPPGEAAAPGAASSAVRAAAAWVAEKLGSATRVLEIVTVDTAGGICSWISAPSPEPAVVTAAIRQQAGATNPLSEATLSPARSTQALASSANGAGSATTRYPVLSLPDAPVRVFLDELDRLGIEVRAVESLWHALAAAWDPSAQRDGPHGERRLPAGSHHDRHADRIVAGDGPTTAIVMLDPGGEETAGGRLVWAWSREGALLAAGSMRLLTVRAAGREGSPAWQEGAREAAADEPTTIINLAKRIDGDGQAQPATAVACGEPEVGRLTLDWLSFSAQTGVSPERVIAIGAIAGENGLPSASGRIGPIAQALTQAWPGATVDAAADEDPIGSTLRRLSSGAAPAEAAQADPRAALSSLTLRPKRINRSVFIWTAAAIVMIAAGLGALGWQLRQAAALTADQVAELEDTQDGLLAALAADFSDLNRDKLLKTAKPEDDLADALNKLHATIKDEPGPRPVIEEILNILTAIEPHAEVVKLNEITYNVAMTVRLTIPSDQVEVGAQILTRLKDISENLEWRGEATATTSRGQEGRPYTLMGVWRAERPKP